MDTSFLIAAVDKSNRYHQKAARYLNRNSGLIYVIPVSVIHEACNLINKNISKKVELIFLKEVLKNFHIELIQNADLERAADILDRYTDLEIGFTEAIFTAVSERLKSNNILTFNKENFYKMIPAGFKKFNILI
ncbi:PIN domain-containing protein [bacterium]|nr:PIN domain-containing protein [bacterium]